MSTVCKNFMSWVQAGQMGFKNDIKFLSQAKVACFCDWVECWNISLENFPTDIRVSSILFFLPKMCRKGGWPLGIFHCDGFFVLIKSSFEIGCQAHIIFFFAPPPSTCYCCLIYNSLLVASPRYWALLITECRICPGGKCKSSSFKNSLPTLVSVRDSLCL